MLRAMKAVAAGLLVCGTAHADEPKTSAAETVFYLITEYKAAAVLPELAVRFDYLPPYLDVVWQEHPGILPDPKAPPVERDAVIDLRFAHFASWNDGRRDRNVMLIECWHYYPCYTDPMRHTSIGHGEINYPVRAYASQPIAAALNHLASFHEKERPKDKFQ